MPNGPHAAAGLFYVAVGGAAITAFYMFRLWYMTFAGKPRDGHVYHHAHESPRVMNVPLVILAVLAVVVAWNVPLTNLGLRAVWSRPSRRELPSSRSRRTVLARRGRCRRSTLSHAEAIHVPVTLIAFCAALAGFVLATLFYGLRKLDAEKVRRSFAPIYAFLRAQVVVRRIVRLALRPAGAGDRRSAAAGSTAGDRLAGRQRGPAGPRWSPCWTTGSTACSSTALVNLLAALDLRAWACGCGRLQTGKHPAVRDVDRRGHRGLFVLMSLYWNYALGVIENQCHAICRYRRVDAC